MYSSPATSINPSTSYKEKLFTDHVVAMMRKGNILTSGTPAEMLAKLTNRLLIAEQAMHESDASAEQAVSELYDYIRNGTCILGSPLLTNITAGHQGLASCSAVPIKVEALSADELDLAEAYYKLNVGSGYDLTPAGDPAKALALLNKHAASIEQSNTCERYIGNIAHVSVRHPRVLDFIRAKTITDEIVHFNTSVDVDDDYIDAVENKWMFTASDGSQHSAARIWDAIVDAAWLCGDPGIISMNRYNKGNALAAQSPYTTTAPCAEVGLAPGESCVFGYVNLAACVKTYPSLSIDLALIANVAKCLTRVLDDALELSITAFPDPRSRAVMRGKRKIGIGVCGFADALMWLGIDYGSAASSRLLADILATVNFESKVASLELAARRGAFLSFSQSTYAHDESFLARFGRIPSAVPASEWTALSRKAAVRGLRNVMTTALPPSGRSALMCDANPSIEPYLTLHGQSDDWVSPIKELLDQGYVSLTSDGLSVSRAGADEWPVSAATTQSLFRTSIEIAPDEHFNILRTAASFVDDGVSKTINIPSDASRETVDKIYRNAWASDLKAISVYRVNSRGIL